MCEFFAAFWYFLVFTIVFLYYRSERSCCHMESWSSQELYSPAMHYSKHLVAASPHGPRPKQTFVAALLSFLLFPSQIVLALSSEEHWVRWSEELLLMAIPVLN